MKKKTSVMKCFFTFIALTDFRERKRVQFVLNWRDLMKSLKIPVRLCARHKKVSHSSRSKDTEIEGEKEKMKKSKGKKRNRFHFCDFHFDCIKLILEGSFTVNRSTKKMFSSARKIIQKRKKRNDVVLAI